MKILGKRKKNTIVELTPRELHTIEMALLEWSFIEAETCEPDKKFDKLLTKIHKEINHFNSLPMVTKIKKISSPKSLIDND